MWKNIIKNRFSFIKGLETFALGCYLAYVANVFTLSDNLPQRYMNASHQKFFLISHAQDQYWAIALLAIGTFAMVVFCLDIKKYYAQRNSLIAMFILWCMYAVFFLVRDLSFHMPASLNFMFATFIAIQLFCELRWGDCL